MGVRERVNVKVRVRVRDKVRMDRVRVKGLTWSCMGEGEGEGRGTVGVRVRVRVRVGVRVRVRALIIVTTRLENLRCLDDWCIHRSENEAKFWRGFRFVWWKVRRSQTNPKAFPDMSKLSEYRYDIINVIDYK